jgi:serine/threonine protein kinase
MAPEVLRCPLKRHPEENKGNRSLQCSVTMDSWATGVLVYELLVGFPPFASDDARDCMNKIMSCCVVFPKRMSAGARAFVEAALSAHPGDRPTAVEMLGDPWIVGELLGEGGRAGGRGRAGQCKLAWKQWPG